MDPDSHLADTQFKSTASFWASTKEGRIPYLVQIHRPSKNWMSRKKDEIFRFLANPGNASPPVNPVDLSRLAKLWALRAEYAVTLTDLVLEEAPKATTQYYPFWKQDQLREIDFDATLTEHWADVEKLALDVVRLRAQSPPAAEDAWAGVLTTFVRTAASGRSQALIVSDGQLQAQAMPRRFAKRPPHDYYQDIVKFPRQFHPDHGVDIFRVVKDAQDIGEEQARCLTPFKRISMSTSIARIPVIRCEWKATRADLDQADGQRQYSLVQAAGIYRNCGLDAQLLTFAVGEGWAWPCAGSWPGKAATQDVRLSYGDPFDLGTFDGAAAFLLMITEACDAHVLSAFELTREQLRTRPSPKGLTPRRVTLQPLVNWRHRRIPQSLVLSGEADFEPMEDGESSEPETDTDIDFEIEEAILGCS
ncbi:hypothetical protein K438DRAFT_1824270 [Mycena galopus ATCC 62051]|nr:hypothetical protein K438DRAFT_1824270 [Mycena galopus ATCC 62051]